MNYRVAPGCISYFHKLFYAYLSENVLCLQLFWVAQIILNTFNLILYTTGFVEFASFIFDVLLQYKTNMLHDKFEYFTLKKCSVFFRDRKAIVLLWVNGKLYIVKHFGDEDGGKRVSSICFFLFIVYNK